MNGLSWLIVVPRYVPELNCDILLLVHEHRVLLRLATESLEHIIFLVVESSCYVSIFLENCIKQWLVVIMKFFFSTYYDGCIYIYMSKLVAMPSIFLVILLIVLRKWLKESPKF